MCVCGGEWSTNSCFVVVFVVVFTHIDYIYLFLFVCLFLILRNDRGQRRSYVHIIFFQSTSSRRQFLLNQMLVSG